MKLCKYTNCKIEVEDDSQFEYCDYCRIIWAAKSITLMTDPSVRLPFRDEAGLGASVAQTLTNLTGIEFLNWLTNTEAIYMELKKLQFLLHPEPNQKKARKTLKDQIDEDRQKNDEIPVEKMRKKVAKVEKTVLTKIERQAKLLGVDINTAKQIFNDDFGF